MVPKLHSKGTSFRGVGMYVLHDKGRSTTSERVEWTVVRNLAVEDPHAAWRVMAATAMSAERLKDEAGIKRSGRKSKEVVQHMTLSWHPGEAEDLSREEMMRAVNGAIRALGAEDRQALIVAHNDEEQPHVHVVINRVSPEDGRLLSSSKERLNLSRWAQKYEEQRGKILCEERVINNAARDRGEYTRGKGDTPRHIYELQAANENNPDIDRIKSEQRTKDARLASERRERERRRGDAWREFLTRHTETNRSIRESGRIDIEKAKEEVRAQYRTTWESLHRDHQDQRRLFDENEARFIGRVQNAASAIDFAAIIRSGERKKALGDAFDALSSSGARLEALKRAQEQEIRRHEVEQRGLESEREQAIRSRCERLLREQRAAFIAERQSMLLVHRMEDAAHRRDWKLRSDERAAAYRARRDRDEGSRDRDQGHESEPIASDRGGGERPASSREREIEDLREQIRGSQDRERDR